MPENSTALATPKSSPSAMRAGVVTGLYLLGATFLGDLPSRLSLARYEAQHGRDPVVWTVFGLLTDLPYLLGVLIVAAALVSLPWVIAWRLPRERSRVRSVVALGTLVFAFALLAMTAATEFRIERGLYPSALDIGAAAGDAGYVVEALHTFLLERHLASSLICLFMFVATSFGFTRFMAKSVFELPRAHARTYALALGVLVTALVLSVGARFSLISTNDRKLMVSPVAVFGASLGSSDANIQYGFMSLFSRLTFPSPMREQGAKQLGFSPETARRIDQLRASGSCLPHPAGSPFSWESSRGPTPVEEQLVALSQLLFEGTQQPLTVWHVVLESLRADEVHALNPLAPEEITPFVNQLYRASRQTRPRVLTAGTMVQAGTRTSHALAALTCGTGMMPFNISFSRDLGNQPLRCLPDVLTDAGFQTSFFYGAEMAFDNMDEFFRYHGVNRFMAGSDYVETDPHRGWGVPDKDVFEQSLQDALKRGGHQYNLLLTLTNHHPYRLPEAHDAGSVTAVDRALSRGGHAPSRDDRARLHTMRYSDDAFASFVRSFESSDAGKRGFVVVHGDHSTADYLLWRGKKALPHDVRRHALSHIPFAIVFPEAFIESRSKPDAVRKAIARFNASWKSSFLSSNDIPRMLLALLASSSPVRSLPADWRWHSIGGQQTSHDFSFEDGAVVAGIHSSSHVFGRRVDGSFSKVDEPASPIHAVDEAMKVTPSLHPTAAFMSSFMNDYASRCRLPKTFRQRGSRMPEP